MMSLALNERDLLEQQQEERRARVEAARRQLKARAEDFLDIIRGYRESIADAPERYEDDGFDYMNLYYLGQYGIRMD